jgi:BASS family bile acid:Na+ symporter
METRKVTFLALSQFLHHHLLWFLISSYAIAAVYPTVGLWIRSISFGDISIFQETTHISLLMMMLALLMFNAGLGLKTSHLKAVMHKKRVVVAGLLANLAIPMAYIFAVTLVMRLWYEPDEAQHILVGLALVAAMPIAGGSMAWAQNSNGNLALSLGLVLCSTLLSPLVTPVAFHVFGEMAADEYEIVLQGGPGGTYLADVRIRHEQQRNRPDPSLSRTLLVPTSDGADHFLQLGPASRSGNGA